VSFVRRTRSYGKPHLSLFRGGGARPPVQEVIAFMEAHMREFGVEPMCKVLQIAPSTWYEHARRTADPGRLPRRVKRDSELSVHIRRVFEENFGVYGVRKVWRQLTREGVDVARCTVARLTMGLQGVVRRKRMKTTINDKATPCPLDKVNKQFAADRPNKLWVSDFAYVATWSGFVYVAFVIDVYARQIWRGQPHRFGGLCPRRTGARRFMPVGRSKAAWSIIPIAVNTASGSPRLFDGVERPPWPTPMDDLGLEQADHRFGERVVVGISDTADRRL
jgi:hypothetical protein